MRYKKYLLITVALLCLLLSACGGRVLSEQEQSFRSALYTWCTRLDTMVYCSKGQQTDWDEASLAELKEASALPREQTLSCETIDRHPGAKAFLLLITQYDQVLEAQPADRAALSAACVDSQRLVCQRNHPFPQVPGRTGHRRVPGSHRE